VSTAVPIVQYNNIIINKTELEGRTQLTQERKTAVNTPFRLVGEVGQLGRIALSASADQVVQPGQTVVGGEVDHW
jgi:hypothetical protein